MANDKPYRVTSIREEARYDDTTGKAIAYYRITFKVGDHGPFVEDVLKADYQDYTVDALLRAKAQTILNLVGS